MANGKRGVSPPKASRLQPSEPLHMKTRRASKATSSAGGSTNSPQSRRSSLNDLSALVGGNDIDNDRSSKRRRVSTGSKTTPTRSLRSSISGSTASKPSTRSRSGPLPPINETPTQLRKRTRLSNASADYAAGSTDGSVQLEGADDENDFSGRKRRKSSRANARPKGISSARRRTSQSYDELANTPPHRRRESSESNIRVNLPHTDDDEDATNGELEEESKSVAPDQQQTEPTENGNAILTAGHEVMKDSNASEVSPDIPAESAVEGSSQEDREESTGTEAQPEAKVVIEEEPEEPAIAEDESLPASQNAEEEAQIDEQASLAPSTDATPAGSPPDQADPSPLRIGRGRKPLGKRVAEILSGEVPKSENDGKPAKRLPGRRRAPHANPKIEAALRRQLHLRMGYRQVAKALKPILAELASRTVKEVQEDGQAHEKAREYETVKAGLDEHLQMRKVFLIRLHLLNAEKLKETYEKEAEVLRTQHFERAKRMKDDLISRLKHDFLMEMRRQQRKDDGYASDDEGGDVIPALRHCSSKGVLGPVLPMELYHWRGRPFIETDRLFHELEYRENVLEAEKEHDKELAEADKQPFTTFDPAVREAALAHRRVTTLVQAADVVDNAPKPPPPVPTISNSDAIALQVLADASTNPAIADAVAKARQAEDAARHTEKHSVLSKKEPQSSPPGRSNILMQTPQYVPEWAPQPQHTLPPRSFSPRQMVHQMQQEPLTTAPPMAPSINGFPAIAARSPSHPEPPRTEYIPMSAPPPTAPLAPPPQETLRESRRASLDFWSNLARPPQEPIMAQSGVPGKVKIAPKAVPRQTSDPESHVLRRDSSGGSSRRESLAHSHPSQQERTSTTMQPPAPPVSATEVRKPSDSFGNLLHRDNTSTAPPQPLPPPPSTSTPHPTKPKKAPAPKRSIVGNFPRSRYYDPTRRSSTNTPHTTSSGPSTSTPAVPQPQPPGLRGPRPQDAISPSFNNPSPHHAPPHGPFAPPFPGPAPTSAPGYGPQMYAHAPQGYGYGQSPYPPTPYGGPPPPPPQAGYQYAVAPGYAPPPQQQGYMPPPVAGTPGGQAPFAPGPPRPPPQVSQPPPQQVQVQGYGTQYGGQPILPAGPGPGLDPRFQQQVGPQHQQRQGHGPVFAQYQHQTPGHGQDGRRRGRRSIGGGQGGQVGQGGGSGRDGREGHGNFRYYGPS